MPVSVAHLLSAPQAGKNISDARCPGRQGISVGGRMFRPPFYAAVFGAVSGCPRVMSAPGFDFMKEKFGWLRATLAVTIETATQTW